MSKLFPSYQQFPVLEKHKDKQGSTAHHHHGGTEHSHGRGEGTPDDHPHGFSERGKPHGDDNHMHDAGGAKNPNTKGLAGPVKRAAEDAMKDIVGETSKYYDDEDQYMSDQSLVDAFRESRMGEGLKEDYGLDDAQVHDLAVETLKRLKESKWWTGSTRKNLWKSPFGSKPWKSGRRRPVNKSLNTILSRSRTAVLELADEAEQPEKFDDGEEVFPTGGASLGPESRTDTPGTVFPETEDPDEGDTVANVAEVSVIEKARHATLSLARLVKHKDKQGSTAHHHHGNIEHSSGNNNEHSHPMADTSRYDHPDAPGRQGDSPWHSDENHEHEDDPQTDDDWGSLPSADPEVAAREWGSLPGGGYRGPGPGDDDNDDWGDPFARDDSESFWSDDSASGKKKKRRRPESKSNKAGIGDDITETLDDFAAAMSQLEALRPTLEQHAAKRAEEKQQEELEARRQAQAEATDPHGEALRRSVEVARKAG